MKIGDLMLYINTPYKEEELIPVSLIQTEKVQQELKDKHNIRVPLFKEIKELSHKHEINPDFLFLAPNHPDIFCYYQFPVFITLSVLDDAYFTMFKIKERIYHNQRILQKALEEGDFMGILTLTDDKAKILILNRLYWNIPDNQRYQIWIKIYQLLDYGHFYIDVNIIEDAIQKQPATYRNKIKKHLLRYSEEEFVTIYRGEGEQSTPSSKSMSWTLSLSVASYFASRYNENGVVKVAKINQDDIIDYLRNRNEEEIIVQPEKVIDIMSYPMVSFQEEQERMRDEGYLDEYALYRNTFIKDADYHNPGGIHGTPHVKRVLFHCLAMSMHLQLSDSERAILANSAIYHDIGRNHDGYCTMHGEWSWKKLISKIQNHKLNGLFSINFVQPFKEGETEYQLRILTKDEQKIVQFLVEYHCRNDEQARENLLKQSGIDAEKAWKLYQIFKDCDGLERIRLGKHELNIEYLRTEVAPKRILCAYYLYDVKQL